MKTARPEEYTSDPVMFMALELSAAKWKVGTTVGLGQKTRERTVDAADLKALAEEVAKAKKRFGLPADTRVVSCYEAGRDGFWIHRWLEAQGRRSEVAALVEPAAAQWMAENGEDHERKARIALAVGSIYSSVQLHQIAGRWYKRLQKLVENTYQPLAVSLARQGHYNQAVQLCVEAAESDHSEQPHHRFREN